MDLLMVEESGHLLPTSVLLPRAAPPLTGSPPFRGLGRTTCCLSSCLVTLLLHLGMLLKMANPRTPELVNPRHQVNLVPPSGSVSLASSSARESGCCGARCFLGIPGGSRSRIVKWPTWQCLDSGKLLRTLERPPAGLATSSSSQLDLKVSNEAPKAARLVKLNENRQI